LASAINISTSYPKIFTHLETSRDTQWTTFPDLVLDLLECHSPKKDLAQNCFLFETILDSPHWALSPSLWYLTALYTYISLVLNHLKLECFFAFLSHPIRNPLRAGLICNSFLDPSSDFCSSVYQKHTIKVVDLNELGNARNSLEV